ncbi:MAG TPA: haloacid dehalogenase type II [Thermoplasmataceae archaeon]|nr:haloacid dehalogenase type II [Thermoplasmatales archaeon AK]HLH85752.1 haloacid dehalogenase type II [Thermoplasmataceae archaeon]
MICSGSKRQKRASDHTSDRILAFDLMGTLLDVGKLEIPLGIRLPNEALFKDIWRRKQLEYSWLSTMMGVRSTFWEITLKALDYVADAQNLTMSSVDRERLMQSCLNVPAFPEVPAGLKKIGIRKVILTNADLAMAKAMVENASLRNLFDRLFSAEEVGKFKPSKEVYSMIAEYYGVGMEQTILVSSNAWDVQGAIMSGMKAVYVNRFGIPQEKIADTIATEVISIEDLADKIGRWDVK